MKRFWKRNKENKSICCSSGTCGGGIYFFGFVGALIYYIQNSTSFWNGIVGILKAIVWPAILIYKLLGFLN